MIIIIEILWINLFKNENVDVWMCWGENNFAIKLMNFFFSLFSIAVTTAAAVYKHK